MHTHVALDGRAPAKSGPAWFAGQEEIDLRFKELLDALAWLERQAPSAFLPVLLEHASDRLMILAVKSRAEHVARQSKGAVK